MPECMYALLNGREDYSIYQGADSSERCTACEVVPQVQLFSEAEKQTEEEQSRRDREVERERNAQ